MTEVATVTMNPAIDQSVFLETLAPNMLNRATNVEYNIGGKGINVSKVLSYLKVPSIALGFLGRNALFFEDELKAMGIETEFVEVTGRTRTNIKVVDMSSAKVTEINEPGPSISEEKLEMLLEKLRECSKACKYVVLSGSLPPGIESSIYKTLIKEVQSSGALTILDAEGDALRNGIEALPFMIKPNIHELEGFLGRTINNHKDLMNVCRNLLGTGVSLVVVSMGNQGSLCASKEGIYRVHPLTIDVKNTVGAGDAMVSGYVYGLLNGLEGEALASFGAAVSCAQIVGDFSMLDSLRAQIRIERWE
jgi:1-phosphofructokinase